MRARTLSVNVLRLALFSAMAGYAAVVMTPVRCCWAFLGGQHRNVRVYLVVWVWVWAMFYFDDERRRRVRVALRARSFLRGRFLINSRALSFVVGRTHRAARTRCANGCCFPQELAVWRFGLRLSAAIRLHVACRVPAVGCSLTCDSICRTLHREALRSTYLHSCSRSKSPRLCHLRLCVQMLIHIIAFAAETQTGLG
jgi:hypothetical protein